MRISVSLQCFLNKTQLETASYQSIDLQMNIKTCIISLKAIRLRYFGTWLLDQLHQPGWFNNLVVSRRSWGAFSIYAHRRRSDGKTKASYSTRESAKKAASEKFLLSVYVLTICSTI